MDNSEENIREILELREWISEEIEKREREIDKFQQSLRILDSMVKQSSFSKASSLASSNKQNIQLNQQTSSLILFPSLFTKHDIAAFWGILPFCTSNLS